MPMREQFIPPPCDPTKVQQLAELIKQIVTRPEPLQASLHAELTEQLGYPYPLGALIEHTRMIGSLAAVAEQLAILPPPIIPDMSHHDYLTLITAIRHGGADLRTTVYWMNLLEAHLPHQLFDDVLFGTITTLDDAGVLDQLLHGSDSSPTDP